MRDPHVAVVGAGITGLAVALGLSKAGARVTLLETDATPLPASPLEAFERWQRRGAPQVRHSHAFLARLRNLLRDRHPELLAALIEHGAEELRFGDVAGRLFPGAVAEPGDEDIVMLACRRITFEWVLRRLVLRSQRAELLDGCRVTGLVVDHAPPGPPRVRGLTLDRRGVGSRLEADFVVDASGRRSKLAAWLGTIGVGPLRVETEPCGIFYASRFYRLRAGMEAPGSDGAIGGDLGYLKYGIFQADDRIFSITLAASPEDPELRALLRESGFERAAAALPSVAAWTDPSRSLAISSVHAMDKLRNVRRHFVPDGRPLVLGLFPLGDALMHTNPIHGRGCTLAWLAAELFVEAFAEHRDDPAALACRLHGAIEREIVPWFQAGRAQDRDAIEAEAVRRAGGDPERTHGEDGRVDPRAAMRAMIREGLVPGLREDPVLLRAFLRAFNLLETPRKLVQDPLLLRRVLAAYERRHGRAPVALGPDRAGMVARIARGRAA